MIALTYVIQVLAVFAAVVFALDAWFAADTALKICADVADTASMALLSWFLLWLRDFVRTYRMMKP